MEDTVNIDTATKNLRHYLEFTNDMFLLFPRLMPKGVTRKQYFADLREKVNAQYDILEGFVNSLTDEENTPRLLSSFRASWQ
ncbi:hypothetical protein AGMMS49975_28460 [Clostridia bacterium]|nr:hypothetical protein AGMMS49975_28460 [Clostridia bacterium]